MFGQSTEAALAGGAGGSSTLAAEATVVGLKGFLGCNALATTNAVGLICSNPVNPGRPSR
jgi:hypothetical protein